MDETLVRERLAKIPLFTGIRNNRKHMDSLAEICRIRAHKAGDVIICEGETGSEMFIVLKGYVEIMKKTRAGDNYTVVKLNADDNVFFGELALIDDDRRSATVTASSDSEFLVITKSDFTTLGNSNPELGLSVTREIARIISGRLRKTTGDMLTIFDALVTEIQG